MKRLGIGLLLVLSMGIFTGCATAKPKVKTTEKFQFNNIDFLLSEKIKTDIKYHTSDELKELLKDKIIDGLIKEGLFSTKKDMNSLKIYVGYNRRFVGDETPLATDSLGYPTFEYKIDVFEDTKLLAVVNKHKIIFQGSFVMNLEVIAGTLRDKKYELEFIQALANKIVEEIVALKS
ncbi:MAG: hypothetical protein WC274_07880 [Sulfurimonas sp.]